MVHHKTNLMTLMTIILKWLSFLPAVVLLVLIFGFSAQNGESSGSLSFQVSLILVRLFSPLLPAARSEHALFEHAEAIHLYVRKAAHMTEYFLLTLSLQLPLTAWLSKLLSSKKRIAAGALLTILFAVLDEFHQSFVPERSGNLTDVCIDSIGVIAASLCLYIFFTIRKKRLAR